MRSPSTLKTNTRNLVILLQNERKTHFFLFTLMNIQALSRMCIRIF